MTLIIHTLLALATPFEGVYTLADTAESLETQKRAALKATLEDLNPLYRFPASRRLEDKPPQCMKYVIAPNSTGILLTCDSRPTMNLIHNKQSDYTTKQGNTIRISSQINDTSIVMHISTGEAGSLVNTFTLDNNTLIVKKTIQSEFFSTPLTMIYNYTLVK